MKWLITGASGLIGRALVDYLLNRGDSVFAAARSAAKFPAYEGRSALRFVRYDATCPFEFDESVDVVVHAASPASPNLFVSHPVETLMSNVYGVDQILKYAIRRPCKVVYVSSSEVYGSAPPRADGYVEEDCGPFDVMNPRSSYPMGKRAAESLCVAYAAEFGVNVSFVRPGHVYGPTATEVDGRVSSLWPRMAARGEDILMKSDGAQLRSYTYAKDCASAIVKVALCGKSGESYNIANPDVKCSIREFAETVAKTAGVALRMESPSNSEAAAFNPMNNSCLNASKLIALGWQAEYDIERGVAETIEMLRG